MKRRSFLTLTAGLAALGAVSASAWVWNKGKKQPLLLSARDDRQGNHYVVAYHLDGSKRFETQVAERCHDVISHPHDSVALYVGRRPSTESYLVDLQTGQVLQTLHTPEQRHFQGHAIIHKEGQLAYTTENDTSDPGRGVLGVWQWQERQFVRVKELSTHGIGVHQLLWMPDGESIVIANGGIRTEADSREMLNLNNMEPSLVLMKRTGELISKEFLADQMNSIRHLAIAKDGTIIAVQQYEGDKRDKVPLVAIKRPNQPFVPFPITEEQRSVMNQYAASVAINSDLRLVAMSAPRGNRFFIWDLDSGETRLNAKMLDCAGIAATEKGFIATSGVGRCRTYDCTQVKPQMRVLELPAGLWDNHANFA